MVYSRHSHTEDPLYHPVIIKDEQGFWKRILIVDEEEDIALAFKVGIEDSNTYTNSKIEVYTSNNLYTGDVSIIYRDGPELRRVNVDYIVIV